MQSNEESDTMAAWREAWLYLNLLMKGSKLPTYIKYSVGEDLLRDMMGVGKRLDLANRIGKQRPYKARELVQQASDLYDQVKFQVNQITDAGYIPSSREEEKDMLLPKRSREHLSKLMDSFGRYLGVWLKNVQTVGNR